jgi:hypothetical protein
VLYLSNIILEYWFNESEPDGREPESHAGHPWAMLHIPMVSSISGDAGYFK